MKIICGNFIYGMVYICLYCNWIVFLKNFLYKIRWLWWYLGLVNEDMMLGDWYFGWGGKYGVWLIEGSKREVLKLLWLDG